MFNEIRKELKLKKDGWFDLISQPCVPKIKIENGKMYLRECIGIKHNNSSKYFDQIFTVSIDLDPDIIEVMGRLDIGMRGYLYSKYSDEHMNVIAESKFRESITANCAGSRMYNGTATDIKNIQVVLYQGRMNKLAIYGDVRRPENNDEIVLESLFELSFKYGSRELKKINAKIQKELKRMEY